MGDGPALGQGLEVLTASARTGRLFAPVRGHDLRRRHVPVRPTCCPGTPPPSAGSWRSPCRSCPPRPASCSACRCSSEHHPEPSPDALPALLCRRGRCPRLGRSRRCGRRTGGPHPWRRDPTPSRPADGGGVHHRDRARADRRAASGVQHATGRTSSSICPRAPTRSRSPIRAPCRDTATVPSTGRRNRR